jgi:hypothetical protein
MNIEDLRDLMVEQHGETKEKIAENKQETKETRKEVSTLALAVEGRLSAVETKVRSHSWILKTLGAALLVLAVTKIVGAFL